jgi:hypothetical protein
MKKAIFTATIVMLGSMACASTMITVEFRPFRDNQAQWRSVWNGAQPYNPEGWNVFFADYADMANDEGKVEEVISLQSQLSQKDFAQSAVRQGDDLDRQEVIAWTKPGDVCECNPDSLNRAYAGCRANLHEQKWKICNPGTKKPEGIALMAN